MVDELRRWVEATRANPAGAPSWAVEPIPVADFVRIEDGRRALRVVGGSTVAPADWIARRASSIEGCRMVRAFRDARCGAWTIAPSSCHVRTCPDCEAQRSARAQAIYSGVAAERMRSPRFVTLTVPNVPRGELRAELRRLRRLLAQLLRRSLVAGGRCRHRRSCGAVRHVDRHGTPSYCPRPEREHVARDDGSLPLRHEWRSRCDARDPARGHGAARGGLVAVEVTYNATTDTWHPHLHLLIDSPYLPVDELRATWVDLTRADARKHGRGAVGSIVWVEAVDTTPRAGESRRDALARAVRETVKYSTKPTPELVADGAALAELLLALRGQRLVSTFGSLYGVPADELDPDRFDELDDTVRVADPDDDFRGWRLPRWCPHGEAHGWRHEAEWTESTWVGRAECYRVRAGPNRSALAWSPPAPAG